MPVLFVQPVRRARVWFLKMGVLSAALVMASVPLAIVWRGARLFPLLALFSFGVTPWLTLQTGSSLAAVVITVALEGALADSVRDFGFAPKAIAAVCALAGSVDGYRTFRSWQALPSTALTPRWQWSALRSLLASELRLHVISLALVAAYPVLVYAQPADRGLILFYYCLLPTCAGAVTVARERQLGVLAWRLALPISRTTQWVVKMAVCYAIVLLASAGIPTAIHAPGDVHFYTGLVLLATTLAIFVSSQVHGALRATVISLTSVMCAIEVLNLWLSRGFTKLGVYEAVRHANPRWANAETLGAVELAALGLTVYAAFRHFIHDDAVRSHVWLMVRAVVLGTLFIAMVDLGFYLPGR
jgi:hypothetical protein